MKNLSSSVRMFTKITYSKITELDIIISVICAFHIVTVIQVVPLAVPSLYYKYEQ